MENDSQSLVSVVIPCYNHEKYVQECIKSVIEQDYKKIELIIIDDGSVDRSVEAVLEMISVCEERFTRFEFRSRPNKGLCETLNEAIDWCSGHYLSIIASDDIMLTHKVSMQLAVFEGKLEAGKELVAVYAGVEFIDDNGVTIRSRAGSGRISGFREVILRTEFLPTPTFFALRKSVLDVGGFNPEYKVEDFYIRLKLTDSGGVFYTIPEVLVKYRRHGDNLSSKSWLVWQEVNKILSDYKDRGIYKKALAFSMMVQAHDYQVVSNIQGLKFILKAINTHRSVLFSKSMLKFLAKLVYKPWR
jgi:alpha-1,3-rhamnosyltransferase